MKIRFLCFIFCLTRVCVAQNSITQQAFELFNNRAYHQASSVLKKAFLKEKDTHIKNKILYTIGLCYFHNGNYMEAIGIFQRLISSGVNDLDIRKSYAKALLRVGNVDSAKDIVQGLDTSDAKSDKEEIKRLSLSIDLILEQKGKAPKYTVEKIAELNSDYSDFAPHLINDRELFFSSSRLNSIGNKVDQREGNSYSDIYMSRRGRDDNSIWTIPVSIGDNINTEFHEGVTSWNQETKTIYYTECVPYEENDKCGIYSRVYNDGIWSEKKLVFSPDSVWVAGHPTISKDGKTLYFSSDTKGSIGGKDIFKITHDPLTDEWGNVRNLGGLINTDKDEYYPSVDKNGDLYFSSDGRPGFGGFDIYKAVLTNDVFTEVEHLESNINSSADDFSITFSKDNTWGFFASNREGADNIYKYIPLPKFHLLKGLVLDKKTGEVLDNVKVKLEELYGDVNFSMTDIKGVYNFNKEIVKAQTNYKLTFEADNYLTKTWSFSTLGISDLEFNLLGNEYVHSTDINIFLDPINRPIVLPRIEYDFNSSELREDSKRELNSLVDVLMENHLLVIELRSHTDHIGSHEDNIRLSDQRAKKCVEYLVSKGVEKRRLSYKGMGETEPFVIPKNNESSFDYKTVLTEDFIKKLDREKEQEARQYNRRTDFKVLGKIRIEDLSTYDKDNTATAAFAIDTVKIDTSEVEFKEKPEDILYYTLSSEEENLRSVADKFNISVAELKKLNGGLSALRTFVGLKLKVSLTADYTDFDEKNYRLQRRDISWQRISVSLNITEDKLRNLNPDIEDKDLKNGLLIKIKE
ncbi:OmpA family protein [Ichthyobacterium seriolicida]|uniref:Peptidoglycan-associated lipoprotein n=1 Tax=Ichthyobacterium seriolicida TaxID=242600 RepID=A0A1J1E6M7_9FLAO|nr:OmpA family protein [Ichthyobacterium seriolicida]BAV94990.1 hypothetical protein JBKA6_0977 [Ichthyobacterium seriolicida]